MLRRSPLLGWARMSQLADLPQTAPVPPQSLDADESVLVAMPLSPGATGAVREILDAGQFERKGHGRSFRARI